MNEDTRKTGQASEQTIQSINSAIELSQETSNVLLNRAVKMAELTDKYYRSVIQIGFDAQENSINVARNYFNNMARINRSWLNLFAVTSEQTIITVGSSVRKPFNETAAATAEFVENNVDQAKKSS